MASKAPDDPILKRFCAAVTEIYGDRVVRAWCCSDPARAATRSRDSDYDVAVFLLAT